MSYILEALKKAEHDREIGQVPRIDSEHERAAPGLSPRWVMVVVLALLINAGLLLVLFWPDEPSPADSRSAAMGPPSASTRAEVPTAPVVERALPTTPSVIAPGPPEAGTNSPARVAPSRTGSRGLTPEVTVEPPAMPVIAAAESHVSQSGDLPVWPQVPDYILQKLNRGLRLDVHVYSESPEDRFVLVNLKKYREGDQLQEGPLLDAITPDGIVLSLQGDRFLVRAQ